MACAMDAMKRRLDVAAGNLANVSSDGFRRRVAHVSLGAGGVRTWATLDETQGALRRTGRSFDVAVTGDGGFFVCDAHGKASVERTASFTRDAGGRLVDPRGRCLLGDHGPLRVAADGTIDERGAVREAGRVVAHLRLSGRPAVQSGFLASSNVDAVAEMVDVLSAQRAFETAQKSLAAIDDARAKAANDVARVRS